MFKQIILKPGMQVVVNGRLGVVFYHTIRFSCGGQQPGVYVRMHAASVEAGRDVGTWVRAIDCRVFK